MTLSFVFRSFGGAMLAAIACGCGANGNHAALPAAGSLDWRTRPPATELKDIYNFAGSPDGKQPQATMGFQQKNNWPVTTTTSGGDANLGAVVEFRRKQPQPWSESVLYSFKGGTSFEDGAQPAGVFMKETDAASPIFVSAVSGGINNNGALVELTPTSSSGTSFSEGFIYRFAGSPDGANPWGAVVSDSAGNLYGTTENGGANYGGTIYRMQPKGSTYAESVVHSFGASGTDGSHPLSSLAIDKRRDLYGTTESGGYAGAGTVFELTPSGSKYIETILYAFQGMPDGNRPESGITLSASNAKAGSAIYGTTVYGGTSNDGTVYKLTPAGKSYKETIIWNFGGTAGDGQLPSGSVCVTKAGVIYGTTIGGGSGGSSGVGTFFTLTPAGSTYKETLYDLDGTNGAYPFAGPSIYTHGGKSEALISSEQGGTKGDGTVTEINVTGRPGTCPSPSE